MIVSNLKNHIEIPILNSNTYLQQFGGKVYFYYDTVSQSTVKATSTIQYELWLEHEKLELEDGTKFECVIFDDSSKLQLKKDATPSLPKEVTTTLKDFSGYAQYFDDDNPRLMASGTFTREHNTSEPYEVYPVSIKVILDASDYTVIKPDGTRSDMYCRWYTAGIELEIPNLELRIELSEVPNEITEDSTTATIKYKADSKTVGKIQKLEACISVTGGDDDVPYREITIPSNKDLTYTFDLTQQDIEALYPATKKNLIGAVRYYLKTTLIDNSVHWYYLDGNFKVLRDYTPTITPIVKDVNTTTVALTGDENVLIKYHSNAYFDSGARGSKGASIASQHVVNGSQTIKEGTGTFENIQSNVFTFNATDTRSMIATPVEVKPQMIEYIKPTCTQEVHLTLIDTNTAEARVSVSGNYFDGSFGAVSNTLKIEIRHTNLDGNGMTDWADVTPLLPEVNNNTYSLSYNALGFQGGTSYVFQSRVTDKLGSATTKEYTASVSPIFDWSETDFNFNVPVNINAENLNMNGETIIQHSNTTNNTVLSATGGHIYVRPGGTSDTSNETVFYADGSVKFGGYNLVDYVIETGTASMGSNGTWYWSKWKSGKAECYGVRNYGNTAVTTAWGGLYRSSSFSQALPSGLFVNTPEVMNISMQNGNMGGWVARHEATAPAADNTGGFIVVRPASATISQAYMSFHIVGRWK